MPPKSISDLDVDKILGLCRDVEVAKAAYEGKKTELLMYLGGTHFPEEMEKAKRLIVRATINGLERNPKKISRPPKKTRQSFGPGDREKQVLTYLRANPEAATSNVQRAIHTDYKRTVTILESMAKNRLIKVRLGKPLKQGKMTLQPRSWSVA